LATPEGQPEKRLDLYGELLPELPVDETLHLTFQQLGYATHGPVPLSWQEIDAFARVTACDISPLEAACLADMSRAFCNGIGDTDPLSVPPMERAK